MNLDIGDDEDSTEDVRRDVDRATLRRRAGQPGSVARGALVHHGRAGGTQIFSRLKI